MWGASSGGGRGSPPSPPWVLGRAGRPPSQARRRRRRRSVARSRIRPALPTRGGPSQPVTPATPGGLRRFDERRAAPRGADPSFGFATASRASVVRDAESGCEVAAVGVAGASVRLAAEHVLAAIALQVAEPLEAVRAVADVAAARPARFSDLGRIAGLAPTAAQLLRPPLRASLDRRGRACAGHDRRSPSQGTNDRHVAEHLATRDPFGFHVLESTSLLRPEP